ncbi:GNAT family N-acetyltransferase [Xanthovirga aplysinae]|uniref:GNAT family N-acetyltransferase n=1 Tax=Xanthovirga aplysinae TaxID=2529853 RepID=UPI0012BB7EAA|nr:N-acetyltransferase [Xanthovirga aplysinae]MTI31066.1 N-acetyltransferase [Xanthovirga aplysinae]
MNIRQANLDDYNAVWEIFRLVVSSEDTYVFSSKTRRGELERHWFSPNISTFVAEEDGVILGTYIIKPNQIDLGSHIANCSYMVHPHYQGRGIGKMLCEHSLTFAKKFGYLAIQFNIVVSTNDTAVRLWKKYGFEIIGKIPKGFRHGKLGYVDAFIMYKEL